jgi:hypothetical protein
MELKDYLHYYLGCNVITTDDNEEAELVGVSDDNAHIVHMGTGSYGTCSIEGVKPILRRLEDMTEEEALHIGKLAMFDRDMNYPDSDFKVEKTWAAIEVPTTYSVRISNDWFEKEIRIGFNTGNIWYANNEINERIFNQPVIFHYLLRQHFDLFGLIPVGLALDAKTIKS